MFTAAATTNAKGIQNTADVKATEAQSVQGINGRFCNNIESNDTYVIREKDKIHIYDLDSNKKLLEFDVEKKEEPYLKRKNVEKRKRAFEKMFSIPRNNDAPPVFKYDNVPTAIASVKYDGKIKLLLVGGFNAITIYDISQPLPIKQQTYPVIGADDIATQRHNAHDANEKWHHYSFKLLTDVTKIVVLPDNKSFLTTAWHTYRVEDGGITTIDTQEGTASLWRLDENNKAQRVSTSYKRGLHCASYIPLNTNEVLYQDWDTCEIRGMDNLFGATAPKIKFARSSGEQLVAVSADKTHFFTKKYPEVLLYWNTLQANKPVAEFKKAIKILCGNGFNASLDGEGKSILTIPNSDYIIVTFRFHNGFTHCDEHGAALYDPKKPEFVCAFFKFEDKAPIMLAGERAQSRVNRYAFHVTADKKLTYLEQRISKGVLNSEFGPLERKELDLNAAISLATRSGLFAVAATSQPSSASAGSESTAALKK